MKKYFVISDIHGFFFEMKEALWQAGFRKTNKDHILIVCGDIFDRGNETLRVFDFFQTLPKKRTVFIRGNHEQLYLELLDKSFPERHDFSNGTVDTFCQIADIPACLLDEDTYGYNDNQYYTGSRSAWEDIKNIVREHHITKWLQSKDWLNYYELGNYIFVHSFIPTKPKQDLEDSIGIYAYAAEHPTLLEYDSTWRTNENWNEATWGCPWRLYKAGLFKPEEDNGKVLVCGHWHTSDFFCHLKGQYDFLHSLAPIYYSKGLIGIDSGVKYDYYYEEYIHPQNVLIITNTEIYECFDKNGNKLIEQ